MFQYPYGDSQQLNLDWLMEQWQETKASIDGSLQGEIDRVEAAITDLLTARDQAVAAQTAAETAATSASGYAGTASGAASTATAQAAAAAASAALAGNHASNAQTSETNAGLQATAAGNSASAAAVSEGNARNSELAAAASSSAAAGNALYAEGFAIGEQNGTPVSSGSPYYENNAKYYADRAAQDASDAADAAQDAHDAAALIDMPATAGDIGKAIIVKTVADGKVSEYEFGEAGGGGGGTPGLVRTIENTRMASITDGTANDVAQLIIDIDAQGGTGWTSANIIRTGKNLYQYLTIQEYSYAWYSGSKALIDATNPFFLASGKTYMLSYANTDNDAKPLLRVWRADGTILNNEPDTLNAKMYQTADIQRFTYQSTPQYYNAPSATNVNACIISPTEDLWIDARMQSGKSEATSVMLAISEIPLAYEPYTGTNYSIAFPAEAGLVTNGKIDVINEKLIVGADEYTLTNVPTIRTVFGDNNIWANTGNIDTLTYFADSKEYIDTQDSLVKALIAKELPNMVADTALVAKDFRIVNNTLYRITAPVSSGGTLTPGTNCTATTVSEVLKSLL